MGLEYWADRILPCIVRQKRPLVGRSPHSNGVYVPPQRHPCMEMIKMKPRFLQQPQLEVPALSPRTVQLETKAFVVYAPTEHQS